MREIRVELSSLQLANLGTDMQYAAAVSTQYRVRIGMFVSVRVFPTAARKFCRMTADSRNETIVREASPASLQG